MKRTVQIGVLNLVLPPPHGAHRYVELMRAAFQRRKAVRIFGDYHGLIGTFGEHAVGASGSFFKFLDIDARRPWFDIDKRQQAGDEDVARIRIPPNLKAHLQELPFLLFSREHKLVFVSRDRRSSLSPGACKKLLDSLFSGSSVATDFGSPEVTVEPQREQLERILELKVLKRFTISLTPPNPDDLSDVEARVMARMRKESAQRLTVELAAADGQSLKPDADHTALARVAQSNGHVMGAGADTDGTSIKLSTTDTPIIEPATVDSEVQTVSDTLLAKGAEIVERLRGRRR